MSKAEEFACRYAGFDAPPTRRDALEHREDKDVYYACLEGYEQAEKDLGYVDWSAFRRNAAKDILCAVMQHDHLGAEADVYIFKEAAVSVAIIYADELIKQLKAEKK